MTGGPIGGLNAFECPFCQSTDLTLEDLEVVGEPDGINPLAGLLVDLYWHCNACGTNYFRPTCLKPDTIRHLSAELAR